MTPKSTAQADMGMLVFVLLCFLGSWLASALLRLFDVTVAPAALGTRLLTVSLLYAATMGWQPIVATWIVRRWVEPSDGLDLGLRQTRSVFSVVGALSAGALGLAATGVAAAGAAVGLGRSRTFYGDAEVELMNQPPSVWGLIVVQLAFLGTIVLVWGQAFAEELGWRGYFLPRVMERFGKWRGLFLHGAVWGLWYAPVLLFGCLGPVDLIGSSGRCLSFAATCILLGALFGWLRLASGSVMPVVVANTTLTLAAGLPYVIHDVDAGIRGAAFGPPGWIVFLIAIGGLLLSRWRKRVQIPARVEPRRTARREPLHRLRVFVERPAAKERRLH